MKRVWADSFAHAAIFLVSACQWLRSAPPKPPEPIGLKPHPRCTDKSAMCSALEEHFSAFMRSCGISVPDLDKKLASSIPEDVYGEELPLGAAVAALPRSSAERAFRFIYESSDLSEEDNAPTSRYLDVGFGSESFPRSVGSSRHLFEYSCSSYVGYAGRLAVDVPVGSFKAAISADTQQNSNILLVVGRFDSPLSVIRNSASDAARRYLDLSFWQSYLNGADPKKARYLDHFSGAVVFRVKEEKSKSSVEMGAKSGIAIGPVSADVSASMGFSRSARIEIQDYSTIFESPRDIQNYLKQAPRPAEIASAFSNAAKIFGQSASQLQDGLQFEQWFDIAGIPPGICTDAIWQKPTPPAKFALLDPDFTISHIIVPNSPPVCRFAVKGVPDVTLFKSLRGGGSDAVGVSYELVSVRHVQNEHLKIVVSRSVSLSPFPTLSQTAFPTYPATTPSAGKPEYVKIGWNAKLTIAYDPNNPVNFQAGAGAFELSKLNLTCGGTSVAATASIALNSDNSLGLLVQRSEDVRVESIDLKRSIPCVADVTLKMPLKSTTSVRSAQLELLAPAAIQSQTM